MRIINPKEFKIIVQYYQVLIYIDIDSIFRK